jgi:hypothetical protein
MKIDVMTIVQDALIGGTNGDMAFKYNNQFIRSIFDSFHPDPDEFNRMFGKGTDYEGVKFYLFLKALLEEECK